MLCPCGKLCSLTICAFAFSRRYGFVEFDDNRDADDAVYELNGKELCGERVVVEHARGPRRDRDSYGGGYGGGGRSKCWLPYFIFTALVLLNTAFLFGGGFEKPRRKMLTTTLVSWLC